MTTSDGWSPVFHTVAYTRYVVRLTTIHSLFQSELSTDWDLFLPLSISSIMWFPEGHPGVAYVFFLIFPSLLSSIFPSLACSRRQFLGKMWPIQLAFLFIVCRIFSSSMTLYVTVLHFSNDRYNCCFPPFSSSTYWNFPVTSDLCLKCPTFTTIQSCTPNIALF